ncbi:MAG TPA: dihydrolipoamide acetyltransferase family protein [Solirubrobacteraceae bacterium]|nr:dihydrolipoamide acetyltransferase family protein [Solirubrobacteraceae bacterium]
MADIVMPRLSDTMEEGTILRWIKGDGDHVARGEELVEIETDKAALVYESDQDGTLHILAAEGTTHPVGAVIARVGEGDSPPGAPPAPLATPAEGDGDLTGAPAVAPPPARGDGERVRASPLARRVARESGVDLAALSGTGPGGRIVRRDVEQAGAGAAAAPEPSTAAATAKGPASGVPLTRVQQTIARRMAEAKATIPDFSVQLDVAMDACVELRAQLKALAEQAPTYNDMVVKAAALALREQPRANSSYRDGELTIHERVNVGVAVADEGTLVVPTIFDADEKSVGEIARATRELAERVRAGAITPPEVGGGTFTVSNLGMHGVRAFTAIINPPQTAILAVGAVEQRAVVGDGSLVASAQMTLTLICDHRVIYGVEGARLLGRIRELLESPASLTL